MSKLTIDELKAGIEAKENRVWRIEMADTLSSEDKEKIAKLNGEIAEMKKELKERETTTEVSEEPLTLFEKLSRIQSEIKAPKNLFNKFGNYKYRNAEGICEAFKKFNTLYNVAMVITDSIEEKAGRVYVKSTVSLYDCDSNIKISVDGWSREPLDKKGMDEPQITGTASSYARKYALNALLLLDDTKDPDTDEYHEETTKRAGATPDLATEPQKNLIKSLCKQYGKDLNKALDYYNTTIDKLTKKQAGEMLTQLKRLEEDGADRSN